MDYYAQYGPLLPQPSRAAFSLPQSDGKRGVIPDFTHEADPAEALRLFIDRLAYPALPASSFPQFKAGAISISCLIVLCGLILARRMYERSFWLFRISKRSTGTSTRRTESVIIPNALLAFTLMAGCFGIILVALDYELIAFFKTRESLPWSLPAWICLPWLAVMHGAVWAAWGTFYARPNAGFFAKPSAADGFVGFTLSTFFRGYGFVNTCCVGLPFVFDVIIIVPTLVANLKYNAFFSDFLVWQRNWEGASALSRDMLIESQILWYKIIACAETICMVFVLWSMIALFVWICYTWVSYQLLQTIRRQVILLEIKSICNMTSNGNIARQDRINGSVRTAASAQVCEKSGPASRVTDAEAGGDRTVSTSGDQGDIEGGLFTRAELSEDEPMTTFFPAVRPSKIVHKTVLSKQATRSSQASYLRRIWWNVFVQMVSISAAILAFLGISIFAASEIYVGYELNDTGYVYSWALLWACWVSVLFGFVVLVAIAGRVYEPVTFGAERHKLPGTRSKDKRRISHAPARVGGSKSSETPAPLDHIQVETSFFETESVVRGPVQTMTEPRTQRNGIPMILSASSPPQLAPSGQTRQTGSRSSDSSRENFEEDYSDGKTGKVDTSIGDHSGPAFVTDLGETLYPSTLPSIDDESTHHGADDVVLQRSPKSRRRV